MNGVEILASNEVAIAWESWNWTTFWIVVFIAFVAALISGIIFGLAERDMCAFWVMFGAVFIMISVVFGSLAGAKTGKPTDYETHYKVTIDDSVSMREFLDKYEILDQEGKIYTVKERE